MSGISSDQTALAGAAYKWRERLLIAAAIALAGCRILSPRHSVAAMVIAVLVLAAAFACARIARHADHGRWSGSPDDVPDAAGARLVGHAGGDEQVAVLAQLPRLGDLDVSRTRITAAGVKQLRVAAPQVMITWEPASQ